MERDERQALPVAWTFPSSSCVRYWKQILIRFRLCLILMKIIPHNRLELNYWKTHASTANKLLPFTTMYYLIFLIISVKQQTFSPHSKILPPRTKMNLLLNNNSSIFYAPSARRFRKGEKGQQQLPCQRSLRRVHKGTGEERFQGCIVFG